MTRTYDNAQIEIDDARGVIYVHVSHRSHQDFFGGVTAIRIQGLDMASRPAGMIDLNVSPDNVNTTRFGEGFFIEALVDSDFDPMRHEAYAYVTDILLAVPSGRVFDELHRQLGLVDWAKVQSAVLQSAADRSVGKEEKK